jgi:hypothetical protein
MEKISLDEKFGLFDEHWRPKDQSYVFFRVTGLGSEDEPVGNEGVPLTPGRSIIRARQNQCFESIDLYLSHSNHLWSDRVPLARRTPHAIVFIGSGYGACWGDGRACCLTASSGVAGHTPANGVRAFG